MPSPRAIWAASLAIALTTLPTGCGDDAPPAASPAPTGDPAATSSATAETSSASSPLPSASAMADEAEQALKASDVPVVDLAGVSNPPPAPASDAPRLASIAMITPVYERPDFNSPRIGNLRAGGIVAMKPDAVPAGGGCNEGWRRIVPAGYVCLDDRATLDLNHPIVKAVSRGPDLTERLPYMYGTVKRGGPAYAKIPTADEVKEFEPNLKKHISQWKKDEVSGATYGLDVWLKWNTEGAPPALEAWEQKTTDERIPHYLLDGGRVPNLSGLVKSEDAVKIDQIDRKQGVAFIDSFLVEGRRWNVSTDLRVMPADRFRPIRGSSFHGWRIGHDVNFPFAVVRRKDAPKWVEKNGKLVKDGTVEWRSAHELTDKERVISGKMYYETKEGFWLDGRHAGKVEAAKRMPKWGQNGEKWISVRISTQVLVAYEGEKAVYATLVSSGAGGLDDPKESHATVRGIFRVHTKHISVTMDSDPDVEEPFELRDVPYVMYFEGGYALHGAYWHDDFGQPRSHGCINLAPEDARRLFWWTEPQVPTGWHGAAKNLTGTIVFVHP